MTNRWQDQFNSHSIHITLDECIKLAQTTFDGDKNDINVDSSAERDRLLKILNYMKDYILCIDADIVAITPVQNNIQNNINTINSYLNNQVKPYIEAFSEDGGFNHLVNANNKIDQYNLINTLHTIRTTKPINAAEIDTKTTVESLNRAKNSIQKLMEKSSNKLSEHEDEITSILDSAKEKKGELENSTQEMQDTISEVIASKKEELENYVNKEQEDYKNRLKNIIDKQERLIEESNEYKDKIKELYNIASKDSVNGGYAEEATIKSKKARNWSFATIGSLVASVGLCAWVFTYTKDMEVNIYILIKSAGFVGLAVSIATYCARQASLNRKQADKAKWSAIRSISLEAYLNGIKEQYRDSEEQLNLIADIERTFAQKLFIEDIDVQNNEHNKSLSNKLQNMLTKKQNS